MDIGMRVDYRIVVSSDEFRIIQKALRGVLSEEDKPKALALQEHMMRIRHKEALQLANEAEKAVNNIEASGSLK